MCGIAGLVIPGGGRVEGETVARLLTRLRHRGPDDHGWMAAGPAGTLQGRDAPDGVDAEALLVHRRLSILDLSPGGWQPMSSADGRLHLVFNGEVYNYLELRGELEGLGHRFRTQSDTEVLLAAWAEWGAEAVRRLVGMFAFAMLDDRERRLVLVRDFFGIKPLYHAAWAKGFAFASEVKALVDLPGVDLGVAPSRLYQFLRFGITDGGGEATFFRGVSQIPPAHFLTVPLDDPQAARLTRYWSPGGERRSGIPFEVAAGELRDLFLRSVELHLRSDVPVGAALSGGIDSSAIVMAMRHLQPDLDLHAVSFVPDDAQVSEERWVDVIGGASGAAVHKVRPSPEELVEDLSFLVSTHDMPFGSTSVYAQHRVFREAAAQGLTVMLDGQGADEMLAGYGIYPMARLASLIRSGRWAEALRFWRAASARWGRTVRWASVGQFLVPAAAQGALRRMVGEELVPAWLNGAWFEERGAEPRPLTRSRGTEVLRDELLASLTDTSLPALLRVEDRNSMAYSIESRVPFLTPQLADYLLSLPEEHILAPDGTSKAVFRRAMRGIVPDAVLDRRDKIGFATPERAWLGLVDPWVRSVLAEAEAVPSLNAPALAREWDEVREGRKRFNNRIWRCLNVIVWARQTGASFA